MRMRDGRDPTAESATASESVRVHEVQLPGRVDQGYLDRSSHLSLTEDNERYASILLLRWIIPRVPPRTGRLAGACTKCSAHDPQGCDESNQEISYVVEGFKP